MKLNIQKHLNNLSTDAVAFALIHAITYADGPEGRLVPDGLLPDKEGNMDVQFIVNGVELPFDKVMELFRDNYDTAIQAEAVKLLHEKASHMMDVLEEMKSELETKATELFPGIYIRRDRF
ncbi:MAG TPA: hypothetical protein PLE74_07650 [Candidatus Cloacimonadota bacterium]|nr:hypothetical protein [Candidatus Cloacimonadota bacterium]